MVNLRILLRTIFILYVVIITYSCRPKYTPDPYFTTFNDYENSIGWSENECNNSATISKSFGNNSKGSVHISKNYSFGYTFKAKLGLLSGDPIAKVVVTSDCKKNCPNLDSCGLVCSITNAEGKIISWQEKKLNVYNNEDDWFEVNSIFLLGGINGLENTVHVFFWNHSSSQDYFIDNTSIKFYGYE